MLAHGHKHSSLPFISPVVTNKKTIILVQWASLLFWLTLPHSLGHALSPCSMPGGAVMDGRFLELRPNQNAVIWSQKSDKHRVWGFFFNTLQFCHGGVSCNLFSGAVGPVSSSGQLSLPFLLVPSGVYLNLFIDFSPSLLCYYLMSCSDEGSLTTLTCLSFFLLCSVISYSFSLGGSGSPCIDLAALQLLEIFMPLPPQC